MTSFRVFTVLLICLSLWTISQSVMYPVDHSDGEIDNMTSAQMTHVEQDLRDQNSAVDKHVVSMKTRITKLRREQHVLEQKNKTVGEAKNWEARQRKAHVRELWKTKAEVEAKKEQLLLLAEHVEKVQIDIQQMVEKLRDLKKTQLHLQEKYANPSLKESLSHDAVRGGPLSQHVVNITVDTIGPEVEVGMRGVEKIEEQLYHTSALKGIFTLFCIYVLAIILIYTCYRCIALALRVITLHRLVFMADMGFVMVWFSVCVCYAAILSDPLEKMSKEHSSLALLVQFFIMTALIGNVILRCVSLCTGEVVAVVELVLVVFIAQHYHQAVWIRILGEEGVNANLWSYLGYMATNAALGIYRARSVNRAIQVVHEELYQSTIGKQDYSWVRACIERSMQYLEDLLTPGPSHVDSEDGFLLPIRHDDECISRNFMSRRGSAARSRYRPDGTGIV